MDLAEELQPSHLAHAAVNRSSQLPPEYDLQSLAAIQPSNEVPVIDLTLGDDAAIAQQIRETCGTGFFYVTGHGVPQALIDSTFNANRRLFSLPVEAKEKMRAGKAKRGWTPQGGEWLDPGKQKEGDTKEGFYMGRDFSSDLPDESKPIHRANQWPDEQLVPGFRDIQERYMKAMHSLGNRLLSLIALSLDLDADTFATPYLFLRPIRYFGVLSSPAEGRFAAGAHSDFGMLTILAVDETPGLQICTPGHGWASVPFREGMFIINLGDMLERWSEGVYRSTLHRVVNTTGQQAMLKQWLEACLGEVSELLAGGNADGAVGALLRQYSVLESTSKQYGYQRTAEGFLNRSFKLFQNAGCVGTLLQLAQLGMQQWNTVEWHLHHVKGRVQDGD